MSKAVSLSEAKAVEFWLAGGDHPKWEGLPKLMERLRPWPAWKHAMTACLVEVGVGPVPWVHDAELRPSVPISWLMANGHLDAYSRAFTLCKSVLPAGEIGPGLA